MAVSIWSAGFTMCPHSNIAQLPDTIIHWLVTTSITSAYMTTAALKHGQIPNVKHSAPDNMVHFFRVSQIYYLRSEAMVCVWRLWKPCGSPRITNMRMSAVCCTLCGTDAQHNTDLSMWEKAIGLHLSPNYLLKSFARVPVVCLIWFLALAIPFFGPINSMMGAFSHSLSTSSPVLPLSMSTALKQLERPQCGSHPSCSSITGSLSSVSVDLWPLLFW
ncbi:hypothetical protein BDL97_05G135500 [Sphagnum fallax]|nr:hypothetical protein BDL97_05G135500 [Sphagnum fallax]